MKKILFGIIILLSVFVFRMDIASASTNDFTISSFKADYYLDKDSDGRSTLKAIESITADFPDIDQNHGIERVIPMKYDGHSTNLQVQSVKDKNGSDVNYSASRQNNNLVLRIGDSDTYVHGEMNYAITYIQNDVTKSFSGTGSDEFYWDVNGTGWSQSFDSVVATVHLGEGLSSSLNGSQSCYYGVSNSTNKCIITKDGDAFITTSINLGVGENVTIAVGFEQGTFNPYKMSLIEQVEKYVVPAEILIVSVLFIIICLMKVLKDKSAPGRGTIVAEYLPPKGIDVALSAVISKNASTWAAATFIDLAVKHKIQILDNNKEKAWKKVYRLKLVSIDNLSSVEKTVVEALFGTTLIIGSEHSIKSGSDFSLANKLNTVYKRVDRQANAKGYYINNEHLHFVMKAISFVILLQSVLIFFILMESTYGFTVLFIGIIAFVISFIVINATKPLSIKGRELLDYLAGLKMYIKIAEADRIRVLQSPQGVSKNSIDTNNTDVVLKLYERVLPYAVLFGVEGEWVKVLGKYYEQQNLTPDWYIGSNIFNAIAFSSAMSSFSTSAAASSNYSSSSSGGSSGGGFSGGGGGGGGGGGW
ncbi:MAG: hypothetical protein PWQ10_374 [Patescibacteria group bacterium]|nr:hypothetical protein [Patescibacteria group bacterium]